MADPRTKVRQHWQLFLNKLDKLDYEISNDIEFDVKPKEQSDNIINTKRVKITHRGVKRKVGQLTFKKIRQKSVWNIENYKNLKNMGNNSQRL